jgi:hypothetical protein
MSTAEAASATGGCRRLSTNAAQWRTAYASMRRAGGSAHRRLVARPARCDQGDASEALVAAEERLTAVICDGRVIGAEEELALARCSQPLGDVHVYPIAAAARLLVEVCEAERGNVVEHAHLELSCGRKGTSTQGWLATAIDLLPRRRICSHA